MRRRLRTREKVAGPKKSLNKSGAPPSNAQAQLYQRIKKKTAHERDSLKMNLDF